MPSQASTGRLKSVCEDPGETQGWGLSLEVPGSSEQWEETVGGPQGSGKPPKSLVIVSLPANSRCTLMSWRLP